jgi:hypothetical protein
LTAQIGFVGGAIVERFDCYEGTPAKAKLSKDLYVQGVNFFARKPISQGVSDRFEDHISRSNQDIGDR